MNYIYLITDFKEMLMGFKWLWHGEDILIEICGIKTWNIGEKLFDTALFNTISKKSKSLTA